MYIMVIAVLRNAAVLRLLAALHPEFSSGTTVLAVTEPSDHTGVRHNSVDGYMT